MGEIKKVTKVWNKGRFNAIRICDMDNDHLINCVCYLKRKYRKSLVSNFKSEVKYLYRSLRKERFFAARKYKKLRKVKSDHPLFPDLLLEIKRRGLKEPNWADSVPVDPWTWAKRNTKRGVYERQLEELVYA